ncbi:MAG: outer membrane beta-barrel protein, partial [Butyricimonas paravirosa]
LTLSYANGNMENKVGLDINLSGSPTSWMTITPSISLVHTHANGKFQGIDLHVDDFSWSGDLELTLNSKKHTELQVLFSYQSPTKIPQFKVEENYYLDLAIKQGFFNDRLQISFSVSDISTLPNGKPVQIQDRIAWQIIVKKPLTLTGSG